MTLYRRHTLRFAPALALLAAACSKSQDDRIVYEKANVILITLDTTRADHLSCYGYPRKTTPNLDKLAAECVKFTMAFSQSSFTPPSHASILTGRYPTSHGLTWWDTKLAEPVATLAGVLRDARYKTAMFSPLAMGKGNALDRGFERVVENPDGSLGYALKLPGGQLHRLPPAEFLTGFFDKWLGSIDAASSFAWLHFYDAHRPYSVFDTAREFCADKTSSFGDDAQSDYQLDPAEREHFGVDAKKGQFIVDRYDSGLLDLDRKVGKLIDDLRKSGRLEKSVLVITADHGEALTEYDEEWFTHDPFLFDAVTHVPLLIRFPDGRFGGKSVDGFAQSIDIMPTLLDYLGLAAPQGVQGHSLRPAIEHDAMVNEFVASERRGRQFEPGTNGGPAVELPSERVGARRSIRWRDARLVVEADTDQMRLYKIAPGKPEALAEFDATSSSGAGRARVYQAHVAEVQRLQPTTEPGKGLEFAPPGYLEVQKGRTSFRCPDHRDATSGAPGKCPTCGKPLEKVN